MVETALVESGYFPEVVKKLLQKPHAVFIDTQRYYEITLIYIAFAIIVLCLIVEALLLLWCNKSLLPANWKVQAANLAGRIYTGIYQPSAPPQSSVTTESADQERIELCTHLA